MKLLVDAGNTRIKLATLSAGELRPLGAAPWREAGARATLERMTAGLGDVESVWASSVAGPAMDAALAALARERWSAPLNLARVSREAHGVRCGYPRPEALGVDRWMALIGARHAADGAVCIADCGTAVTLDALDPGGRHLGGAIAPGRRLMREALAHGTAALPQVAEGPADLIAVTTEDGIAAGCDHAVAALVERFRQAMAGRTGAPVTLLVTGGDAPALAPLLSAPTRLVPDLVLRGLAVMAAGAEGPA